MKIFIIAIVMAGVIGGFVIGELAGGAFSLLGAVFSGIGLAIVLLLLGAYFDAQEKRKNKILPHELRDVFDRLTGKKTSSFASSSSKALHQQNTALNDEWIAKSRAQCRLNGDLLFKEVCEKTEKILTDIAPRYEFPEMSSSLTVQGSEERGQQFLESIKTHIEVCTLAFVMGLIGLRRTKGKAVYITGIEYKQLKSRINQEMLKLYEEIPTFEDGRTEKQIEEAKARILLMVHDDLQDIGTAIVKCCDATSATSKSYPESVQYLLNWYKKKAGFGESIVADLREIVEEATSCETLPNDGKPI